MIIGIDPGTEKSGMIAVGPDIGGGIASIYGGGEYANRVLLQMLRGRLAVSETGGWSVDRVFIETIEPMGLAVGKSTLETMRWVGRFEEASDLCHGGCVHLVSRLDERITLCGAATYKNPKTGKSKTVSDPQIRAALIQRFPATGGGKVPQIGTKAKPGPLYGISGHMWSALAVVVTGWSIFVRDGSNKGQ
ncbi:MAG: hypothetical protein PHI12_09835 [Dehalococcoidales bacterium]|nr:hypothetical protein [Dehalococcoidales bacterium]